MLDIGWSEFLVIGVIALVVIGPKELPVALRTAGRFVARARALANEFREGLDDIARETEMKDIQKRILEDDDDWLDADAVNRPRDKRVDPADGNSMFDESALDDAEARMSDPPAKTDVDPAQRGEAAPADSSAAPDAPPRREPLP